MDSGDLDAARAILAEQLSYWKATDPGVASSRAVVHALLVAAMLADGDVPEALRTAALADAEFTESKVRPYFVATDAQLEVAHGLALAAGGDCANALPRFERSAALYRRVHVAASPWLGEAEAHRAICLFRLGRSADAQAALVAARAALAPHPRLSAQFTQPLRRAEQLAHAQVVAPARRAATR
jgi:tetratricopeptide (TPR) repeat protein